MLTFALQESRIKKSPDGHFGHAGNWLWLIGMPEFDSDKKRKRLFTDTVSGYNKFITDTVSGYKKFITDTVWGLKLQIHLGH